MNNYESMVPLVRDYIQTDAGLVPIGAPYPDPTYRTPGEAVDLVQIEQTARQTVRDELARQQAGLRDPVDATTRSRDARTRPSRGLRRIAFVSFCAFVGTVVGSAAVSGGAPRPSSYLEHLSRSPGFVASKVPDLGNMVLTNILSREAIDASDTATTNTAQTGDTP